MCVCDPTFVLYFFMANHTVIRFSGWRSEIVPKQGVDLAALHAFA